MQYATNAAKEIKLLGTVFNMPKPQSVEQCGENEEDQKYSYLVTGFQPLLAEKNITEIELMRELKSVYSFSCDCEHDCCGCYLQQTSAHAKDGVIHLTVFGSVNN